MGSEIETAALEAAQVMATICREHTALANALRARDKHLVQQSHALLAQANLVLAATARIGVSAQIGR